VYVLAISGPRDDCPMENLSFLIRRWAMAGAIGATMVAGCSNRESALQFAPSTAMQPNSAAKSTQASPIGCKAFVASFDEFVACERANGTLHSLSNPEIAWRVRFFVRYLEMPCNEAPTVQEAYVFHMVIDDLSNDSDLTDTQRVAIRNAMFQGKVQCN